MTTSVTGRALLRPKSVREALAMLRDEGPLTPLAGCTDLYVALNFGTLQATRFLDLWRLDRLRPIEVRGGVLSIGALATYTDLIRSALVRRRLPMLAAAAREVGGVQIQNRGTIGGNVVNASPAGDTLPVLAAADASAVLASATDVRRVPVVAFYTGYRQTVRRPGGTGDFEGGDGRHRRIASADCAGQRRANRDAGAADRSGAGAPGFPRGSAAYARARTGAH